MLLQFTHHIPIGLAIHAMREDRHNKEIDDKGDKQRYGGLNKEIEIRFAHFLWLATIHVA